MSTNSSRLDEAGMLSTDAATVSDIREWILARLSAPVTPEWLKKCAAVYRPARGPHGAAGRKKKPRRSEDDPTEFERQGKRLWMLRLERATFNEHEETVREAGEKVAKKRLSKPRRFQVEDFRWHGDDGFVETVHRGDRVIQIMKEDDGRILVHPVGRLVHVKRFKTRRGTSGSFMFLEMPRTYRRRIWGDFRKALSEEGIDIGKQPRTREIRDPVMDDKLSALIGSRA